jgi:YegS/Rv2252/BmrU family lipid kinase
MPVTIIINPISGRARTAAGRSRVAIARAVTERLATDAEIVVTERAGHAHDLARHAAARGVQAVVAWGGDGTINEVASALAFSGVPLGIVPAGSGNGLARELGISFRADRAIESALRGSPRAIDVGEIEQRLFVNAAGIGVDAHIASRFNASSNTRRGLLGYAHITVRAMVSYVPMHYRVTVGGVVADVRAVLVTIANSAQFGNGARIAPGAKVDDGLLDLVVVPERSRLVTVANFPRLFTGGVERVPGCRLAKVSEVTVEADEPMTFHVDGEPVQGGKRLHAKVHPGALKVLV